MKLSDALRKSQSLGLDLVEIAPTANPPVCKLVDFGKLRYDISPHSTDRECGGSRRNGRKFRVNKAEHDDLTTVRRAEAFNDRGDVLLRQWKCGEPAMSREL